MNKDTLIAHIRRKEDRSGVPSQPLIDHFEERVRPASEFAEIFKSSTWAYAEGLEHDTGMATPGWQHYGGGKVGKQDHSSLTTNAFHKTTGLRQVVEHHSNLGEVQLLSADFFSSILAGVKLLIEYAKSALSSSYSATWPVLSDKPGSNMANQRSPWNISSFQFQATATQYFAISKDEVW